MARKQQICADSICVYQPFPRHLRPIPDSAAKSLLAHRGDTENAEVFSEFLRVSSASTASPR